MTAETANDNQATTKVAIVEDNATLRQYLAELISNTPGYQCICACGSAEEALETIPAQRPHVVLMDIHLPGESGIACTARLREKMPKIQVIMLTVYKDIQMIFQALKAGACGYVLKRADEKEILAAIAEVRAGGAPMTSQVARMVVRSFLEEPAGESETEQLSPREKEILALVAQGRANKEIGRVRTGVIGNKRTGVMGYTSRPYVLEESNTHGRDYSICDVGAEWALYRERAV